MTQAARAACGPTPKKYQTGVPAVPFQRAEEAWLWTMAGLIARRDGARRGAGGTVPRPCEPDDVVKCMQRLCDSGKITQAQARILCFWGSRQMAPSPRHGAEQEAAGHWRVALGQLECPLRDKGIVA